MTEYNLKHYVFYIYDSEFNLIRIYQEVTEHVYHTGSPVTIETYEEKPVTRVIQEILKPTTEECTRKDGTTYNPNTIVIVRLP